MATRRNRIVSLLAAIAVGGLSAPAQATELPPPDNPDQDTTQYQLPWELDKYTDLEFTASVDPGIAQLYEDFMFDFDDECWEEGGESSQPIEVTRATLWAEHHTRWMGDADFSEILPLEAVPDLSAPSGADSEQVKLTADVTLAEELSFGSGSAETLEVHPALLHDENTEPRYPVSGYLIDTRYWEDEAESIFLDCLYESDYAAAFAFAQTTDMLVSASPSGLPDPDTIEACYDLVDSSFGDPCIKDSEELCLNLEWHESWCGRRAYSENGASPSWACYQDVENAIDDYMANSGATVEPILLPSKMYRAGEVTEHRGLQRAPGVKIQLSPDTTYGESDHALPNAEVTLADRLAVAADRLRWAANGEAVTSCEEYAYEYYQDMSILLDGAKTHQRNPRWTFEAAYAGRDGVGPFISSGPTVHTKSNFRGSNGDLIWLNASSGISDHGFVPWSRASWSAPAHHRQRHRLYEWQYSSAQGGVRLSTFKNVYYFLHRLRKGPTETFEGTCDTFKSGLYNHYRVNAAWHKRMNETAANAGFLDEEMELMRGKQDALWEIYQQYLLADDPSVRADLTKMIDDGLREGFAAGCIPNDPSAPTACDWAPSIFSDGVLEMTETWQHTDYDRCVDELGEAEFTDDQLKAKFVDVSNANAGLSQYWLDILDTERNAAISYPDFTASTAGIRNYLYRMRGGLWAGGSKGYRDRVAQAVSGIGEDSLVRRAEFEKTMGGEFFGTRMQYQIESGGMDGQGACASLPTTATNGSVTVRMGAQSSEMLRSEEALRKHAETNYSTPAEESENESESEPEPEPESEPECEGSPWECNSNVWINGSLTHEPGYGTTLAGGIGGSLSKSVTIFEKSVPFYSMGWATATLRLGASGFVKASVDLSAQHTTLDDGCTCDCSDPSENPLGADLPDLGICEENAGVKCECLSPTEQAARDAQMQAQLDANGGEEICNDATVTSINVSTDVGAGISGNASLGISFAKVLEVGIRGSLTLIGVSVPATLSLVWSTANEQRAPKFDHKFRVKFTTEMLSGSLSLYVLLDAVVTTITLFELVLARWSGFRLDVFLLDDRVSAGDMCLTSELAQLTDRHEILPVNDNCPCVLRPANCKE